MERYENLRKIDAHVHFNTVRDALFHYGAEHNFRFLSINTDMPFFPSLEEQEKTNLDLISKHGQQLSYATSFSCTNSDDTWQDTVIEKIKKSIALGAIGVKVWKNIGMSIRNPDGSFLTIDNACFDPIFHFLEENDIVLLGHIGEPKNCWLPLDEMTVGSDRRYFSNNQEYHMHLHPECLPYEAHLRARDLMLKKHPRLRYVGLHLASEEWNTDKVAHFLDNYPNTMVDLAERICHLQHQTVTNWQKVRDFLVVYQDRIIYGTDCVDDGSLTGQELVQLQDERYRMHWKFFAENELMTAPKVNGRFRGMGLPTAVLKKIYGTNAIKTYGI